MLGAVAGLFFGALFLKQITSSCHSHPTTKMVVNQIAHEAYALWDLATGEACPEHLSDLENYRNSKNTKDGWGNELVMVCGEVRSDDIPFFVVISKGPDGRLWTEDDIRSS